MTAPTALIRDLQAAVGRRWVLHTPEDLLVYEYDATIERGLPEAVVLPDTAEDVAAAVRLARRYGVPVTARGAGTGLSGGAIPCEGGVVIATARMNRILEVDAENRLAVVEPGVINLHISQAVAPYGLYYAPDPSSQKACTIGGNVAENAGGPHTLRYGSTTNHVLGLEIVTPDGEIMWLGGKTADTPGYDLTGVVVGSEGTLAIVTKVIVRLLHRPESTITLLAIFDEVPEASETVSAIIAAGDPARGARDDRQEHDGGGRGVRPRGYPPDAGAALLIEVEGLRGGDAGAGGRRPRHLRGGRRARGPRRHAIRRTASGSGRAARARSARWAAWRRRTTSWTASCPARSSLPCSPASTRPASATASPSPTSSTPATATCTRTSCSTSACPAPPSACWTLGEEIMRLCVDAGGTITGEHGVGYEKRNYMSWIFSEDDLEVMARLKLAFGAAEGFNPGKVFPSSKGCGEVSSRMKAAIAKIGPDAYV